MPTLVAPQPSVLVRGDTWPILVTYTNPDGSAVDLDGSIVTGELCLSRNVLAIPLAVANGGLVVTAAAGQMLFTVAPAITSAATPDPVSPLAVPAGYPYPNRLQVVITDSLGEVITRGVVPILVCDARNVPIGTLPPNPANTIVAVALQGPPGPAISVNGHVGPVQTVTAHDVGSYTTAEIDAAILAATPVIFPVAIAQVGQAAVPLPNPPPNLTDVALVVDGREFRAPFITVSATQIAWNGPFLLEPADDVFVRYR